MRAWLDIRSREWAAVLWSFVALGLILAAHSILETARDALFLASLPAEKLPWVYLAIAGIGLVLTRFHWRVRALTLSLSLVVASGVTTAAWFVISPDKTWTLYALYIWSGFFATGSVVQLWIYIGAHFTSGEGKRLFGFVGTGGIVGAIAGSLIARVLTHFASASALVLAAAIFMLLASLAPIGLGRALRDRRDASLARASTPELAASFAVVIGHRYVRRLGLLVLIATFALTIADYIFKSIVSGSMTSADELGEFFATFYTATNIVALILQLAIVPLVLRYLGLTTALVALPALMIGGALGIIVGGGLFAASALKGIDGSLRHSLFRTAIEVLYLPLTNRVRGAAKLLIDIVGQRGGQAIGSLAILLSIALVPRSLLALVIAVLACFVLWIILAVLVRIENLNLFRKAISVDAIETTMAFPDLDVASLEVLMSKLNSLDDREVRAVIEILAETGRSRLVPDLILFHPSHSVVRAALELFRRDKRTSFVPIAERLIDHADSELRAAALLTLDALGENQRRLARFRGSKDVWLAAAAVVASINRGKLTGDKADAAVDQLRAKETDADLALARATALVATPAIVPLIIKLAQSSDPRARRAVVHAARLLRAPELVEPFLPMLGERALRDDVRTVYVEIGAPAVEILASALANDATKSSIRHHLPRTISRFSPPLVFPLLFNAFSVERDEVVRYKLLRGLGRLRAVAPTVRLDHVRLDKLIDDEIESAVQLFAWRHLLTTENASPSLELLSRLLKDKLDQSLEVVFRLLGLEQPWEDLESIYHGIRSDDRRVRDSAHELLSSLLDRNEGPILVLLDDLDEPARAAALGAKIESKSHTEVLKELSASDDKTLRELASTCLEDQGEVNTEVEAL